MLFDFEYKPRNTLVLANALFETHSQNQHSSSSVSSPPERSESGGSARSKSAGSAGSESAAQVRA